MGNEEESTLSEYPANREDMKELFLPYNLALLAKEKGFDEFFTMGIITSLYNKDGNHVPYSNYGVMFSGLSDGYISAPLYQQIIDWFREKHSLALIPNWSGRSGDGSFSYWHCQIHHAQFGLKLHVNKTHYYEYEVVDGHKVGGQMVPHFENLTYYQCLDKAIEEAFKLI